MSAHDAHHLQVGRDVFAGNGDLGRVVFLPGSSGRARRIGAHFDGLQIFENKRHHDIYTGTLTRDGTTVDVAAVSTGMGCPSLGVIVAELVALGVHCMVRVGTSGSMQHGLVDTGALVVATGAVRDEAASDAFAPRELAAVAHPLWVAALSRAAAGLGHAERTFLGLVHTKDSLYGREMAQGPLAHENARYMEVLTQAGVVASEMESSHLFVLAQTHGPDLRPLSQRGRPSPGALFAGSVLAIIGDQSEWAPADQAQLAVDRAIDVALQGAVELLRG